MKRYNVFAPVDGVVKTIEECSDSAFSQKMLGDGFLIIPESKNYTSIFEKTKLELVFDTKHAFFLKAIDGPKVLMHIGLDTVSLKGKPFNVLKTINDEFTNKETLVEVNLDLIKESNILTETPIVFDQSENVNYKFVLEKTGKVKQGEQIGYFEYILEQNISENIENINTKNKYQLAAEQIYQLVGTSSNFSKHYNCMTRLRFNIADKSFVKEDEIKKISLVKGINWNGPELQIIIGGSVYKVKEEVDKLVKPDNQIKIEVKNNKKGFKDKALGFISGVIVPTIPIILAAGLLMAIKALLLQFNAIDDIKSRDQLINADVFSAFMYIISEVGLGMLGIFLCISTVKYLNGDIIVGAFVGVAIASPYLIFGVNWILFDWGFIKIKLTGYYNSIIPQITAGAIYVYADRWVKTWMPSAVDICFRTLISFVMTMVAIMFVLGPILGVIEGLLGTSVRWLGNIPFGIGVMLFAMLWQPLVLTGMHVPIITVVMQNLPSPLYAASVMGVFGQLGAVIAVANITNNYKTKEIAYSTIPASLFGITEPLIYGITLPRFIPFLTGCLGAGVAGLITGLMGIEASTTGGMGVLGFTRFIPGGAYQIGLFVLSGVISISAAYLFTILLYKERADEKQGVIKTNKVLIKYLSKNNYCTSDQLKELLIKLNNEFKISKEDKKLFKTCEKYLSKISKYETKINQLQDSQEDRIVKLQQLIESLKEKNKIHKIKKLQLKIDLIKKETKIETVFSLLENEKQEFEQIQKEFIKFQDELIVKIHNKLTSISKELNDPNILVIENNYYNAIHSLDINFELADKQENLLILK